MTSPLQPISSPCVKLCIIDGESGLCLGCHRTLPEVARWGALSETERRAVMAELAGRKSRIGSEKLAMFGGG